MLFVASQLQKTQTPLLMMTQILSTLADIFVSGYFLGCV